MSHRSIFEIIGSRYLDTQHSMKHIQELECELRSRNIVGVFRWALEYITASGVWWNIIWWDETSINGKDVLIGWVFNLLAFGFISALVSVAGGRLVGVFVFIALHLATTVVGFRLRSGTAGSF